MDNRIFPIFKFQKGCRSKKLDLGTGFFVNSEGMFITAAHVCKNEDFDYCALINSNLFVIEKIYLEYKCDYSEDVLDFQDLFIGKISELSETAYIELDEVSGLKKNDKLSVFGYKSIALDNDPQIIRSDKIEVMPISSCLYFYEISGAFYTDRIIYLQRKEPCTLFFYNAITVKTIDLELFGLSGGPLMLNGKCYGMLFREDSYLSATYLKSKLRGLIS